MKRILGISLMFALVVAAGCGSGEKEDEREEARQLFAQLSALTSSYTAKIAVARDSAAWASLAAAYEDSLAKINFRFPPDTDLEMSEGENDTLYNLTAAYVAARDTRIHDILHPKTLTDSIAADSLKMTMDSPKREVVSASGTAR